jgi:hypothetical protein
MGYLFNKLLNSDVSAVGYIVCNSIRFVKVNKCFQCIKNEIPKYQGMTHQNHSLNKNHGTLVQAPELPIKYSKTEDVKFQSHSGTC